MNDDGLMDKKEYLHHLKNETKVFQNPAVEAAFEAIDRKDFVGVDYDVEAYEDYALPTLKGQTMPQPTTVAFLLELLDPQKGDTILDIGSGSGWTTALLGHMVGAEGKVFGIEKVSELVEFGQKNIKKYTLKPYALPIEISAAGKETGLYTKAPFNRILSSAAFSDKEDPAIAELMMQLVPGGVMVVPIGDSIFRFEKEEDENFYESEYPGFAFKPYVA